MLVEELVETVLEATELEALLCAEVEFEGFLATPL